MKTVTLLASDNKTPYQAHVPDDFQVPELPPSPACDMPSPVISPGSSADSSHLPDRPIGDGSVSSSVNTPQGAVLQTADAQTVAGAGNDAFWSQPQAADFYFPVGASAIDASYQSADSVGVMQADSSLHAHSLTPDFAAPIDFGSYDSGYWSYFDTESAFEDQSGAQANWADWFVV
jgi:hypothetical protein